MTPKPEVGAARRISAEMVDAAHTGKPISLAVFVQMAEDAGITTSEGLLRLAIRVAYFNAELASALLTVVEHFHPGHGEQVLRDIKVRTALAESE